MVYRKNTRRNRKATRKNRKQTRRQSGGFLSRFFGKKPTAAAAPGVGVAPPVAAPPGVGVAPPVAAPPTLMNAARKYVNSGLAAGKDPYYLYMDADEAGVMKNHVRNILKEKRPNDPKMKNIYI